MVTKWSLDPSHSEVQFKVKHMVISTVSGEFTDFTAAIVSQDEAFADADFTFSAEVKSVNTKNADRDQHLRSEDFFYAENFPQLFFQSNGGMKDGKIEGKIEIRGVKQPLTLDVDFGGVITDPYGNQRAGFEITGEVNRKDFGLTWSQMTEAGGLVVSDKIRLIINLEFVQDK